MFVITNGARLNLIEIQECQRAASVLASNQVHLFEGTDGPQRNVLEVSDRRANNVKLPALAARGLKGIDKAGSCCHKRLSIRDLNRKLTNSVSSRRVYLKQMGKELEFRGTRGLSTRLRCGTIK